jgi:uncharacterized RDD family membrane protein YckC
MAGEPEVPNGPYVGLITRGIAIALDAALINVVAFVVGLGTTLIVSLLRLPHDVKAVLAVIAGGVYVLWTIGYFVGFWAATGQTPGARIMRFRVVAAGGERIKPRRGILRCIGLVLAALPLFAGYVLILFDDKRRGLQDRIARTVVVEAPQLSYADARRLRQGSPTSGDDRRRAPSQA